MHATEKFQRQMSFTLLVSGGKFNHPLIPLCVLSIYLFWPAFTHQFLFHCPVNPNLQFIFLHYPTLLCQSHTCRRWRVKSLWLKP